MAGWTCAGCTTTYAVGAAKCPQCGSTERTDAPGGSVLPSVTVACATAGCRYAGAERRVHLRTAAPGVLEMPPLVCAGCGSHVLTLEDTMPKITVHGGPSNAAAEPDSVPVAETPVQGGEESSPVGTTSSTSSEAEPTTPEPNVAPSPKRARTTGSRSKRGRTDSSSVPSTDGGQAADTSAADD